MKRLTILSILSIACQLIGAPSTPITRGRLTTDLDAAGHSITNGPMATTNFVWEVVGSVTNNLPRGGIDGILVQDSHGDTNTVFGLTALDGGYIDWHIDSLIDGRIGARAEINMDNLIYDPVFDFLYEKADRADLDAVDVRTNLPPLSASATVGDLVDALNAIANALRPKEEEEP